MGKFSRNIFSILIIIAIILTGCSNDGEEKISDPDQEETKSPIVEEPKEPMEGGILKFGVLELPTWDPFKWNSDTPSFSTAERLVYRGLFTYDEQGQLVPDLIDSYSIDKQDDHVAYLRLTLNQDAKWHDGTPVTFEDVSFTLHTYLDPFYYGAWKQNLSYINGTSAFRSGKADTITGIQQNENGEIVITVSDATSSFYHALTAPVLPAHQLKGLSIEEMRNHLSEGKVVGNGPFAFESKTDTEVRLTRVDEFSKGGPYLDGISFVKYDGNIKSITDTSSYDMIAVTPQQSDDVLDGYTSYDVAQNVYYYLGFNVEDELLKNKDVRRAIYEAINPQLIIEKALYGNGEVVNEIVSSQSWLTTNQERSTNVDAAKQRMASLGYSDTRSLEITIHYQGDSKIMERVVGALSEQLSSIYIKVNKQPLNGDEYYAHLFAGKPVQAFLHAWPFSKDIGYWWKLYGGYHHVKDLGLNIYRFQNDQADSLLKELYYNPPGESQRETAQKFMELLNQEQVVVPLFVPVQTYWVSTKVHDQQINGDGWFSNIEKWWMEN